MRSRSSKASLVATLALLACAAAGPADAACKKMGFLVNDYGKDGPTEDAKRLLDEHVAKWATEQGIKNYTVGKKDVSCELFLNLILFDEHTCTASANSADTGIDSPPLASPRANVSMSRIRRSTARRSAAWVCARSAACVNFRTRRKCGA